MPKRFLALVMIVLGLSACGREDLTVALQTMPPVDFDTSPALGSPADGLLSMRY